MVSGPERLKDGGRCGHARAENRGRLTAFEAGEQTLDQIVVGIVGPRIETPRNRPVVLCSCVRRGGMNGWDDGTGRSIHETEGLSGKGGWV